MHMMSQVFRPFLRKFIMVYFDDILISSRNEKENIHNLHQVLTAIEENRLMINLKKCLFLKIGYYLWTSSSVPEVSILMRRK